MEIDHPVAIDDLQVVRIESSLFDCELKMKYADVQFEAGTEDEVRIPI